MPNPWPKIELGENRRRAVSVLMRGTARACDEVEEWVARPSSVLTEVRADLTPHQETRLRELAAELKAEVGEFSTQVVLDKKTESRRRSIAAIVSTALTDLQEAEASGLQGYGPLSQDAKAVLNESIRRMAALLEQMLHIVEFE
jgi:hypothetical protein